MRKVFSSQRVENAEAVAQMLRDADIEVRLSNGRSYHSKRRGQFSYLDKSDGSNHPAVWVVHANDQPRAREILRDAGLLQTTRRDHPTAEYAFAEAPAQNNGRSWAWRIRIILLAVIAGVVLMMMLRQRSTPTPPPAVPAAQTQPAAPVQPETEEVRVRIQPSNPPPKPAN